MNKEVKIGDYVEYTPTAKTSSKYKIFDSGLWEESDRYFKTETGNKALKWRYMGKDENGSILLVADRPTDDKLYLFGKDGYVNGPAKLNDLCKELYSSSLGEARSINVDDVNKVLGANHDGMYRNERCDIAYNPKNLTIGELISKKCERVLLYVKTPEEGKNINDYVPNYYSYMGEKYKKITIDSSYNLIFKNQFCMDLEYWLASSCVYADFDGGRVHFFVRYVDGDYVGGDHIFNSYGYEYGNYYPVRPVVSLKSGVKLGEKVNGVWTLK